MKSFLERIDCWNHTRYITQNMQYDESVKYYYDENFVFDKRYSNTQLYVINDDTLDSAITLMQKGFDPLVLNFADDCFPGGAVRSGSGAQEESIFRRTNYHQTLQLQKFYPIRNNECVYSPNVAIVKSAEKYNWNLLSNPIFVHLIACPGIKYPKLTYDTRGNPRFNDVDEAIFINKVRLIFQTAYNNNHDSLVLGALSCGAWNGPITNIAKIFKKVLDEYDGMFACIIFAILKDSPDYVVKSHGPPRDTLKIFTDILLHK